MLEDLVFESEQDATDGKVRYRLEQLGHDNRTRDLLDAVDARRQWEVKAVQVETLKENFRSVFTLHRREGIICRKIAEKQGISFEKLGHHTCGLSRNCCWKILGKYKTLSCYFH